jgi:hypothetical protein
VPVFSPLEALKDYQGHWNLEAIGARSKRLADQALQIWSWSNV